MRFFSRLNLWFNGNSLASYLLLFLICLIFFTWMQSAPTFADPDSFYHIKTAVLMSQTGIIHNFPYLRFTTLKDGYIDHHFLYHVILVPFVVWLPPMVGAKLAHIILDALVILVFYWLLNKLGARGGFWCALFLLGSTVFIFRVSLIKAQPLSLIILFLGIYLIVARRYWLLGGLAFIYVWAYGGWFLLLILAGLNVLAESAGVAWLGIQERWWQKILKFFGLIRFSAIKKFILIFFKNCFGRENLKLLFSVIAGLILGVIFNPYFPKNLDFYWIHIIKIAFVNYQDKIGVGAEWYPYSFSQLARYLAWPFILLAPALILFLNYFKKFNSVVKFLGLVLALFFIATLKSRRNVEYLIPLAVIFSAAIFTVSSRLPELQDDLKKIIAKIPRQIWRLKKIMVLFLILAALSVGGYNAFLAKQAVGKGIKFNYLKSASEFLIKNSQPGDIIFHSDWDDFPPLFYHNNKDYYLVGLDPTFMYLYNADLYEKWRDITLGRRIGEMRQIIKEDFQAKYVFVTQDHKDLIRNLDNNFYFVKIYEDKEAIIYQVL